LKFQNKSESVYFLIPNKKERFVGEIRISVPTLGTETHHWSIDTSEKLKQVVCDWVTRVETGEITHWAGTPLGEYEPITTEHLRIAKDFVTIRRAYSDHENAWRFEVSSKKSDEEDTGEMSEEELETWKKLRERADRMSPMETE